ncbi:MAG: hypothetical protein ACOC4M_14510 [Promethearchaeia archaeon]
MGWLNRNKEENDEEKVDESAWDEIIDTISERARSKQREEAKEELMQVIEENIEEVYAIWEDQVKSDIEKKRDIENLLKDKIRGDKKLMNLIDSELRNRLFNEKFDIKQVKDFVVKEAKKIRDIIQGSDVVAFVRYYRDWNAKNYTYYGILEKDFDDVWIHNTDAYLLTYPSDHYENVPVYVVAAGIPFSLPMEFGLRELNARMQELPEVAREENIAYRYLTYGRAKLSSRNLYYTLNDINVKVQTGIVKTGWDKIKNAIIPFLIGCLGTSICWLIYINTILPAGGE